MVNASEVNASDVGRGQRVDAIAEALPVRASAISRLFLTRTSLEISRTEANVMRRLTKQPRRITDLAFGEGVTQPAMTLLVNRLEDRGWLERETDPSDRRAVLVKLTASGAATFERLRAEYRALLHEEMAMLPDEDVAALARAVEILDGLIERLTVRHT
jgi:DNA-binding MarR family transcriptional regulator